MKYILILLLLVEAFLLGAYAAVDSATRNIYTNCLEQSYTVEQCKKLTGEI